MKFWEKIKSLVGTKAEPTQTDEAMVTANGRILSDHPSNCITPSKLKSILEDAENGDITAQHELFMDIEEQDSAIGANIQTRKRAILTLDWRIAEPRNATPAEEKLQTEIDELFYQYPDFENLLMDMMDAVGHGFAALEIEWELEGGKYIPSNFIPRPQSWFRLDKDDNLLLKTPSNTMGEPLRQFGWVVHSHKSRSVQLARMGLFRTLAWLYMFKHYSVRDFAEFLELYGMPIRIGKYGAGATNEEKRTLLRALAQIGHNAAGIMPDSMTVELHNAANSSATNNPFLQMTDWCEKSIARLILGQTLTSGADGKSSTNALGNVHNKVRRDLLVSDAKQVAQTITQQIILPYLQINVDPNIALHRVPYFEFDTKKYDDLSTFADAIPKLVSIGVQIPEKWTRDKLGIPEAQDGEAVLKPFENELKTPEKPTALSAQFTHEKGCACGCQLTVLSAVYPDSGDLALPNQQLNQQMQPLVTALVKSFSEGKSYDDAMSIALANFPHLSDEQLITGLSQALFVADVWGRINGKAS